jgi:hypothetical protein
MPPGSRARGALAGLAALVAAALVVALARPPMGDYTSAGLSNPDNAAPAIGALVGGHPGRAIDVQPVMGPVSLVLRWPFAALGHALGDRQLEYWFGAAACLWVLALLAGWLALRARALSRERLAGPAVALLLLANPVTLAALSAGHPEELLAAALAVAAVLAAARDRAALTGVLLALGVATKPWAALAGPVALLVLSRGHARAVVTGAVLTALLLVPLTLANPDRTLGGARDLGKEARVYAPSAWWPVAERHPVMRVEGAGRIPDAAALPAGLTRSAGQLAIAALTLALVLAYMRRRRPVTLADGLALLAGLMLARCLLDPVNLFYYGVPFVVALVAWETHARRGVPLVSIAAGAALWLTAGHPGANRDLMCALYLAWSVPLAAWLCARPARLRWRLGSPRPARTVAGRAL